MEIIINLKWVNQNQKFTTMNKRLEFLQRKNKGKQRLELFVTVLINSGFKRLELEYIDLEKSDEIIEQAKDKFKGIDRETELLGSENLFIDSDLLRATYLSLDKNDTCYIYTDDFQYCGMFIGNARRSFELAFEVAKNDFQNTCFILDTNLKYSFLINYNDESDNNDPNSFDIQLTKSPE